MDNKIVEKQIEKNNVSKQEVVDQTLVKQNTVTEQQQTLAERQMAQVTETVETQIAQHQEVTAQAVSRVKTATPVMTTVPVKAASNASYRQVATFGKPTVKGHRKVEENHQVKRPSTAEEVAIVSNIKTTKTELAVKPIPSSVEKIATISSGTVHKSTARVHHAPTQRSSVAKIVAETQPRSSAVQSTSRQVIRHETALTKIQPAAVKREIKQDPIVVTDYNWIADTLAEKVKRLKRYPTRARRRMWEGTVELRVAIRADGEIEDVHVLESSGHRILDQEALKTVKLASPLTLRHFVDRPMVMIDLPIVYELN
jgi:TonB family protein